jgi:hypothetical protein
MFSQHATIAGTELAVILSERSESKNLQLFFFSLSNNPITKHT